MSNPLEQEVTLITGEKIKVGEFWMAYDELMKLKNNKPHIFERLLSEEIKQLESVGA